MWKENGKVISSNYWSNYFVVHDIKWIIATVAGIILYLL